MFEVERAIHQTRVHEVESLTRPVALLDIAVRDGNCDVVILGRRVASPGQFCKGVGRQRFLSAYWPRRIHSARSEQPLSIETVSGVDCYYSQSSCRRRPE